MSPLVFLIFAPVVVMGIAFAALLLGAAAAGAWEAAEHLSTRSTSDAATAQPTVAAPEGPRARAA